MSEINIGGTSPTEETQAASEKQAATKPQGHPAAGMGGGIGDLAKLKAKMDAEDPTMWNKWMQGIASEITNKWRKFPERLKQIRQESERR